MVHGGIRYLENGEFRLVREAVRERNRLIENAPHYVNPLPTVIPIFNLFSGLLNVPLKFLGLMDKPAERGAIVIKIGLLLYDSFTMGQNTVPRHQFLSKSDSLNQFPSINPDVRFTAHYYDGLMKSPERICIELVIDGEAANTSAHAVNYVAVEGISGNKVILKDQMTGDQLNINPDIVINATGPWIDLTNSKVGISSQFIGGTKGSHLILDNPELRSSIGENEIFFENKDGRIVLMLPLGEKVLIGTSDLPIEDPDDARCTEEEVGYFFDMVDLVFPEISVSRDQIIYQFSGVRPLPASDSKTTGQISRDHSIKALPKGKEHNFPIYNLVGGKWTSFRAFSEDVTNKTLSELNLERKLSTRNLPIGGGLGFPNTQKSRDEWIINQVHKSGLSKERISILFERYGTRAENVIEFISIEYDQLLINLSSYSRREIQFITQEEKIVHLDDFLLRRSTIAKTGLLSLDLIDELENIISEVKGWSNTRRTNEVERLLALLDDRHGVRL
jgi:glycerol-3-phosphate dehydrogenase